MTIPMERVETRILTIRGHRVMVDTDLAEVYGVPTRAQNQAIKRNAERFPEDFAFRLTAEEKMELVTKGRAINGEPGSSGGYRVC